jgi:hypothetical protein
MSCGATEGIALGHSWVDATFDAPKTCEVCYETEGQKLDKFTWLKNYVTKNGDYDYEDGTYEYTLYITGTSNIFLFYDPSNPDELKLEIYQTTSGSDYATLTSITLTESLGGDYVWVIVDTYYYYMVGTVYGSSFTSSTTRLGYSDTDYPSTVITSARELGATQVKTMLLAFNLEFAEYGLTAYDLGFAGY